MPTIIDQSIGLLGAVFFLSLFSNTNNEFILEMSDKLDSQNQMKVILDNLQESILIYSHS
jgi:hypothetical protein